MEENKVENKVDIDFDEASAAWRSNKRLVGIRKGVYEYCCGAMKKNGEYCKAPPYIWNKSVRRELNKMTITDDKEPPWVKEWSYCKAHKHLSENEK